MRFTHVFISRPRKEAEELAALLLPLGLRAVVQPAFSFFTLNVRALQPGTFDEMSMAGYDALVVFTSPRSVTHGLSQIPEKLLFHAKIAAIGPATAKALSESGIRVNVIPLEGYTSEALLETIRAEKPGLTAARPFAFIIAAPGGRQKMFEGLNALNWRTRLVEVYKPEPAKLEKPALRSLQDASGVLCVWTSANAMKAMAHRLPPATWFQLCQGDWLVISERLKRLARAYGPERIHLAPGPGNADLLSAIRSLV